jgi:hypothetical protein
MPDYMLMVLENETEHAAQSPTAMAGLIEQRARFVGRLRSAGQLRDHGRFRPSREGKRARRHGARLAVEGGPFVQAGAEGGKALGAFYWVQASTVEEATQLAIECPALPSDQIDVRPVMKGVGDPDKEAKPGKIFGFVVLGNAVAEDAWVGVMDRIDAETSVNLPDSFMGGVRLEPPTSGRRVETRGGRRAMFDGPFLESKEVIGGLFFVRVTSHDDALRWFADSRHGVHGAIEIRELWRS